MLTVDGRTLKYHGYGRIKLNIGIAEPAHVDTLIVEGTTWIRSSTWD